MEAELAAYLSKLRGDQEILLHRLIICSQERLSGLRYCVYPVLITGFKEMLGFVSAFIVTSSRV